RGDLKTTAGNIDLQGATVIGGDLLVRKSRCFGWCWGDDKKTRITIGAGVRVLGQIRAEREVELWVHDSAQIGPVSGAEARRYSAERP
ncbi:MAG: hypothetical protein KDI60_16025, partial [Xanthomonadales bacterium]|nr:hypothetical protein [Xanthomonadales bacterium]